MEGTPHGSGPGQRREACRELVCTLEGREPRWASGQVEGEQTCLVFQLGAMCVWVCTCSGGKVGVGDRELLTLLQLDLTRYRCVCYTLGGCRTLCDKLLSYCRTGNFCEREIFAIIAVGLILWKQNNHCYTVRVHVRQPRLWEFKFASIFNHILQYYGMIAPNNETTTTQLANMGLTCARSN